MPLSSPLPFDLLSKKLSGKIFFDLSPEHQTQLLAYSTDASVYQEKPVAVALPKNNKDLILLVEFANQHQLTLIPRAAGTSLAGQVVGNGIVVDISKYFLEIIELNVAEKWIKVQPGVIRDDLNFYLKPFGLMFGPETSTANRAMIGGMIGNNSCGLHSIVWGAVRDHLSEVKAILSDGSEVLISNDNLETENSFYQQIKTGLNSLLTDVNHQNLIHQNFPNKKVTRRNTGYALDALLGMQPYHPQGKTNNLCELIAGSEGTLCLITEAKLNLIDLPPQEIALVCIHTNSIDEALKANIIALQHQPYASELVDKFICDFTINHPEYHKNRFFIVDDPAAILMVEFMGHTANEVALKANHLITELKLLNLGFAYPVLKNGDTKYAWDIRKAGLGLLRNLRGDIQPVNLIEDCAVSPNDLPDYIKDLEALLAFYEVKASYYAHAGAGELHVEPMINLKSEEGLVKFRSILNDTAKLVKKYGGSLSGEHGDGRLRGEFIESMVGSETYDLFKKVKAIFDPNQVFNAGKITNTPPMDTHLRVKPNQNIKLINTTLDFSESGGILALAEKCSGSGDCRKSAISGGVMCPSYMATRLEKDTTRARANVLRQYLSLPANEASFNHPEIKEVMDMCLSCKGCKTECPSGVDVAKMKAEFLQNYYDENGSSFRAKLIGNFRGQMKLASIAPFIYNAIFQNITLRRVLNSLIGFHPDRTLPKLANQTLRTWFKKHQKPQASSKKVYLFCDEFTNYNDVEIGKKSILLLEKLGYEVIIPNHLESGRTYLSKGFVKKALVIANQNIALLKDKITENSPLIGVEPSAILTFRDEYIDLANPQLKADAIRLSKNCFTVEEFIAKEIEKGNIKSDSFHQEAKNIKIHGHCYQKALSSQKYLETILSLPKNYRTELIASGCCGMAGSFGYEKEHYEISQQIGELVLFPEVRNAAKETIIAASGTSCRHQIKDGTNKTALHPVEILWDALVN
ncbi:FAD-binding protein [Pedobacter psychrophilus]|uniref:FAD-binding protein n=1 Tax=Pedobacter psychrophilus TaxID=1826909 RepID=A0A179DFV3_9SPHI|nr:FAD-binding oxidoreductase [Pedobacter psychrophilus]OAQ39774.1 FAD-binding protein [Pedobacter psychrophilus]